MAVNDIALMGAVYPDVPQVVLPVDGGGTATFTDVSDTTAAAADVASGKYFYTAQGVKTEGTGSGGGGTTWETVFNDTVSVTTSEDDYYMAFVTFGESISYESVWRITWNGTPYECTATSAGITDFPPYAIGNNSIIHLQGGNNEPFYLQKTGSTSLVVVSSQSQTVSLKIEKQVSGGGGGGADCPTFTINYDDDSGDVLSASCDKTYAECIAYLTTSNDSVTMSALIDSKFYTDNELTFENITGATGHLPSQTGGDINYSVPDTSDGMITAHIISFSNDGTITVTDDPVERRTSNNLTASTLTVTAPAGYYAQNATKTLTDNNLLAGNIKNGVSIFGVTGNYGGGGGTGLDYETGTYTPASNTAQPTISFANSHSSPPFFAMISDTTGSSQTNNNTILTVIFGSWYNVWNQTVNAGGTALYGRVQRGYRGSSTSVSTAGSNETNQNSSYVSNTNFTPSGASTSQTFRSGRTYKWIAVWAPTS